MTELGPKIKKRWEEVMVMSDPDILGPIRAKYRSDVKKKKLTQDKVAATIVGLIDQTLMRIGSEAKGEPTEGKKETYGVTTLKYDPTNPEESHINIDKKKRSIQMNYPGKGEVPQEKQIKKGADFPELFDSVAEILDWSAKGECEQAFCFESAGKPEKITDTNVRDYMQKVTKEVMKKEKKYTDPLTGEEIPIPPRMLRDGIKSLHNFRKMHSSNKVADEVLQKGKVYEDVLGEVSHALGHYRSKKVEGKKVWTVDKGNTAEKSYIHPDLVKRLSKGRTSRNPTYSKVRAAIQTESGDVVASRHDIIEWLRRHPKSTAWDAWLE